MKTYARMAPALALAAALPFVAVAPAQAAGETDITQAEIDQALASPESGLEVVSPGEEDAEARASQRPRYSLSTAGAADEGYVTAGGSFEFRRHGTAIRTVGNVNDACPGNGKGAYLYAFVKFENGGVGKKLIRRDVDTCEGPGNHFDVTLGSNSPLKIRKALVLLVERDAGSPPVAHDQCLYVR